MAIATELDMKLNRRTFVAGAGATLGAAGLSSSAGADASIPVEIAEVYPEEDVVILQNTGDEDIDLGGYVMDWEHEDDTDQTDPIPEGTTIGAGQHLSVWAGFQSTQVDPIEADVRLAEYDNGRINASEPDVIALLSPDGGVVDQFEYSIDGPAYNYDEYAEDEEETEDDEAELQEGVEFEYNYTVGGEGDDEYLEERLELSSGEYYVRENEDTADHCYITGEAENLTDDEEINIYFSGRAGDNPTHESQTSIAPGEITSLSMTLIECPGTNVDQASISAWVPYMGEPPEEEDNEDVAEDSDEGPENEPDESGSEEGDDGDTDHENRDNETDEDCPEDEETGTKNEKKTMSKDEDCPEEEPEPEPEPEDDC